MAIILDQFDRAILKELQINSSISNLELSKKIGLSASACLSRTKNLIESGTISQFTIIADEKKLGLDTLAFALINLTPLNRETIHTFLKNVKKFPQVQECYTLTGNYDFLLKIIAKDMPSYKDFIIDSLMQNAAISRVETSIVMEVDKRSFCIPIDDSE